MTPPRRVLVRAPAKLNLCLHVGERRPDGYHDLESLVAFASVCDDIELVQHTELSLTVHGPFADAISAGADNLAVRAARLFSEQANTAGAAIRLEKRIPVAAGLGGGSADAAAVLRGLEQVWQSGLGNPVLNRLGEALGADVPVCLSGAPAWMTGKGEHVLRLADLPQMHLLLVNPGVPVPTASVFAQLRARRGVGRSAPGTFADAPALVAYLCESGNDLEAPACAIAPVIGAVLDAIARRPGALFVRMSGSGATCFGLFADERPCREAAAVLRHRHPAWWIKPAVFVSAPFTAPDIC